MHFLVYYKEWNARIDLLQPKMWTTKENVVDVAAVSKNTDSGRDKMGHFTLITFFSLNGICRINYRFTYSIFLTEPPWCFETNEIKTLKIPDWKGDPSNDVGSIRNLKICFVNWR